ncbi:MAG: hypothetical protein ACRD1G_11145, partial [Acidimicrobiales bacterium]
LSKCHRAMIERFQPYRPWKGVDGEHHPLRVLQALTNDDKHLHEHGLFHRLAYVRPIIGRSGSGHNCRVDLDQLDSTTEKQWVDILFRELKAGAELFRLPLVINGPDPRIDLDVEGLTYVAMGQGLSVVQSLGAIAEMALEILRAFEPEFDRPVARRVWIERAGNLDAPNTAYR